MDDKVVTTTDNHINYQRGRFVVTEKLFRGPRRTYQLSRIEKTEVRRPLLPFLIPLALAIIWFTWAWGNYLYYPEIAIAWVLAGIMLVISFAVGSLNITSKAVDECAAYGFAHHLQLVRAAIDNTIEILDVHPRDY